MSFVLFALLSMGIPSASAAEEARGKYIHQTRTDIPGNEQMLAFGMVYLAQWAFYVFQQHEVIAREGSFGNWRKYPFRPHFDYDGIEYNLIQHSLAGNYYYLFYRSHGHTRKSALLWAVASSTAFEFTIETVTERPSFQDLYQTPILGSLLGMGLESASLYLHSQGTWPARFLGYVLNPFTLFPYARYGFHAAPLVVRGGVGASIAWEF